ncbi:major facilitator super transporter protein [Neopestalotiopsis sp. 37M]|nr:major facilitator super transporter protein [Neopestalotiopsis sp. 37M]
MHQRSRSLVATGLLAAANLLIPAAILIFAAGFFPYKPFLAGYAQYDETDQAPAAPFDRVVFMVVDALRSDFVFAEGSGFEFTQGLIRDGAAIPFTAHAASPTVTMPRLKAITTGSVPSFLDVILNLDEADSSSTLAAQDTWLAQMKAKQSGKLVMFGDDTWLKLFPDTFDRADGTSSFFVSDYTEVDNNVTRHIDVELQQDDWSTMVLHYLGLDHIGHKSGPRSSAMLPKQREMDDIVRRIYQALETQSHLKSTLLVLCGDHGMNDAGNHGASSAGETSPALVFLSPILKSLSRPLDAPAPYAEDFQYYSRVQQSDLAPTLGALLGFPTPKNNLGAMIPEFLPLWPNRRDQAYIMMHNAKQIFEIVSAASGDSLSMGSYDAMDCSKLPSDADKLACEWHILAGRSHLQQIADNDDWDQQVLQWLREAQHLMSSMASNYDTTKLTQGVTIALISVVSSIFAVLSIVEKDSGAPLCFAAITLLYGIMMFASSYVEEEQHFWYWATTAWLVYLSQTRPRKSTRVPSWAVLVILVSIRLVRGWNQTGQKFAGNPDLVKIFLAPNPQVLWCLVIGTYGVLLVELISNARKIFPDAIASPLMLGVIASAISFKIAFANEDAPELVTGFVHSLLQLIEGPSLLARARAVLLGLALASVYPVYFLAAGRQGRRLESKPKSDGTGGSVSLDAKRFSAMALLHSLYTVLALTQSRVTNIPLFLLFRLLHGLLQRFNLGVAEVTTSAVLLQFASFFAMGGSNAISSVDLSSAYNGVSGFNVLAVGLLTFVSNWAAPIWWTSATNLLLLQHKGGCCQAVFLRHGALLTLFVTTSLLFIMVACTALRTHLFIWTVFSPKYLYSMAWSLGHHLGINLGVGGLLYWLGNREP